VNQESSISAHGAPSMTSGTALKRGRTNVLSVPERRRGSVVESSLPPAPVVQRNHILGDRKRRHSQSPDRAPQPRATKRLASGTIKSGTVRAIRVPMTRSTVPKPPRSGAGRDSPADVPVPDAQQTDRSGVATKRRRLEQKVIPAGENKKTRSIVPRSGDRSSVARNGIRSSTTRTSASQLPTRGKIMTAPPLAPIYVGEKRGSATVRGKRGEKALPLGSRSAESSILQQPLEHVGGAVMGSRTNS
jgi:hypothetical protein